MADGILWSERRLHLWNTNWQFQSNGHSKLTVQVVVCCSFITIRWNFTSLEQMWLPFRMARIKSSKLWIEWNQLELEINQVWCIFVPEIPRTKILNMTSTRVSFIKIQKLCMATLLLTHARFFVNMNSSPQNLTKSCQRIPKNCSEESLENGKRIIWCFRATGAGPTPWWWRATPRIWQRRWPTSTTPGWTRCSNWWIGVCPALPWRRCCSVHERRLLSPTTTPVHQTLPTLNCWINIYSICLGNLIYW